MMYTKIFKQPNLLFSIALLSVFFLLSHTVAPVVLAQEEEEGAKPSYLEEIIVTAQRREQNLMDVPISIDVIGGDQIQFEGIEDIQRLAEELPALVVGGQSSSTGGLAISLRGLGSTSGDPAVGYYVDEIYQASASGFVTQFLDVERIEVLKGPQGTLWGRNTTAGAVHYITKKPNLDAVEASFFAEFGTYDTLSSSDYPMQKFGGSINTHSETFALRVSAAKVMQDNFTYNTYLGGTQKNQDATTIRADLLWEPNDNFSATLGFTNIDDPYHNAFTTKTNPFFAGSAIAYMLNFVTDVIVEEDTWKVNANAAPRTAFEETGLRLGLDWKLNDSLNLRLMSASKTQENDRFSDLDATAFTLVHNSADIEHDWRSHELQLFYKSDRLNVIGGVYYFGEERDYKVNTTANYSAYLISACNNGNTAANPTFAGFCPVINGFIIPYMSVFNGGQPFTIADLQPGGLWDVTLAGLGLGGYGIGATDTPVSGSGKYDDNSSYAVYGQASYQLTDTWTGSVGVRWTKDKKNITGFAWDSVNQFTINPAATGIVKDDEFTPKLGLEWRPDNDSLYYASITRGFKSGGLNIYAGIVGDVVPSIKPESITAFEIGAKRSFNDGVLLFDGAVYYYDYEDYQLSIQYLDGPQLTNLPDVSVTGVEAAVKFNPTESFSLGASFNYVDSSIDSDLIIQDPFNINIPDKNVKGNPLPRSPEFKGSLTADYTFVGLRNGSSLIIGGALNYSDEFFHDLHGTFPGSGYTMWNANIRWVSGGNWWLNLYGRNLTNEEYQTFAIYADSIGDVQFYNPPRTIGVQMGYKF
jgi:iron complex outermembrane receptor protein